MWSNAVEDDIRAMKDIGEKTLQEVTTGNDGTIDLEGIQKIKVDKLLEVGNKGKTIPSAARPLPNRNLYENRLEQIFRMAGEELHPPHYPQRRKRGRYYYN